MLIFEYSPRNILQKLIILTQIFFHLIEEIVEIRIANTASDTEQKVNPQVGKNIPKPSSYPGEFPCIPA